MTPDSDLKPLRILRWAFGAAVSVMVLGVAGGVLAMLRLDFAGAGACLLDAGVTAGLMTNAVLRR